MNNHTWSDVDEWEYQGFDETYRQRADETRRHEAWQWADEEYQRKQVAKLQGIEDRYAQQLAAVNAYYATEFARVEALYGLGELPEAELAALRYELIESARADRARWGERNSSWLP